MSYKQFKNKHPYKAYWIFIKGRILNKLRMFSMKK
jgi:hypothetical protein